MSRSLLADEPLLGLPAEIDDESLEDSEIRDAKILKTIRQCRLSSIAFKKHYHMCQKYLGLSLMTETTLSVVEETSFEDSICEDLCSEACVGDGDLVANQNGEMAMEVGLEMAMEVRSPDLEDGGGCGNGDGLSVSDLEMEYDRARAAELPPDSVAMYRILIPLYFKMVNSFFARAYV